MRGPAGLPLMAHTLYWASYLRRVYCGAGLACAPSAGAEEGSCGAPPLRLCLGVRRPPFSLGFHPRCRFTMEPVCVGGESIRAA